MQFVILSDTHIPHRAKRLPDEVWSYIEKSDGVIHAGDFSSYDFYLELCARAGGSDKVFAVWGNMDEEALFRKLPERLVLELGGIKIGIYHGSGAPFGIEKRVFKKFSDNLPDIIIFGHSHIPLQKEINGVILFNPGSPTDKIFATKNTFGILTIENNKFTVEHINLK